MIEPAAFTTDAVEAAAPVIRDYDGPRGRARSVLAESLARGGDP